MSIVINLQKWGNSQGIRIPKAILEILKWDENESLELTTKNDQVIIKRSVKIHKRKNIKELFANYKGDYKPTEFDWGKPVGKEIW